MRENIGNELLPIVEGAAIVEAADSGLVRNSFAELQHAMGADIQFAPSELSGLEAGVEHVVDAAQGLLLPAATILIMYAGLKHMFTGGRKRGRS